jgi:hypothetical protein
VSIKNFNHQHVRVATSEFGVTDIVAGVATAAVDLPAGAVITGGHVKTLTAWNSTTSDVLDVGDATTANRYLNDGNIRAAGALVALVPTGEAHAGGPLNITWVSGGGTPTTGASRLVVEYIVLGSSSSTFG